MPQSTKHNEIYCNNSYGLEEHKEIWSPKEGIMILSKMEELRVGSRKSSERRYNLNYALKDKWIPLGWKEGNNISDRDNKKKDPEEQENMTISLPC